MLNQIGLDKKGADKLSEKLNVLLSSFQIFYQNLRGLHWNIKGNDFFELHVKYEEFYNDAQIKIDEIAERILTLGGVPVHSFKGYLDVTTITSKENVFDGKQGVQLIVDNLQSLLKLERDALEVSDQLEDEGTNSMMSDFITEQEKTIWMLNSWLGNKK